jgi:mannose-6-phosphate isomerase-like protein (cupin superfamily)
MERLRKVNIREAFESFDETWSPKALALVNDFAVKAVKLDGEFIWHHHAEEDEVFIVLHGRIDMHYRIDGTEHVESFGEGEMLRIPHGLEHKPVATAGTQMLLIERTATPNTGNVTNSARGATLGYLPSAKTGP